MGLTTKTRREIEMERHSLNKWVSCVSIAKVPSRPPNNLAAHVRGRSIEMLMEKGSCRISKGQCPRRKWRVTMTSGSPKTLKVKASESDYRETTHPVPPQNPIQH
ncbi:hypothetical protein VTN49DRAFT_4450 [Thermomyces lanuginosus]|uniref:uncharacterized protein n=1 Tax=Thermomyces lanuginosus TaxID=5541 RepID=UPI003743C499